ncbi:MAG: sugar ABC transporter permease, partial [Anaerolineae bacterium]|nr:sugar ABC transporter permease [Anaerolineae bacterium]
MALAATDKHTQRGDNLRPPIDPARANFIGLLCATVIIAAFLFLPWYWTEIKYNGGRIMSDVLVDGTYKGFSSVHVIFIPIAALIAGGLAVWGLGTPERGMKAAGATFGVGLFGLAYYGHFYFIQDNELIDQYVQVGTGFKVALAAMIGLVVQIALLHPVLNDALYHLNRAGSARLPSIPQKWVPYLFMAVPMILYLFWIIGPTVYSFYLSFTNWDGV